MPSSPNHKIAVLGILSIAAAIPPAAAQQNRLRVEWNDFAPQYRGQTDRRVTLICGPGGTPSNVYGTGVYSDNSFVCSAATHAGVINANTGGVVTIVISPDVGSYPGSTQNGVTSQSRGAYAGSYRFEIGNVPGQLDWTTTAVGLSTAGKPLTLVCPPGGEARRIWGTDTYTEDTPICSAAVHAGHITLQSGGTIMVQSAGAQEQFTASSRNGMTSLEWRGLPVSFRVSAAPSATGSVSIAQSQAQAVVAVNDVVGVTVSPSNGLITTEAGGTATFTIKLNAQPTADVVIPLASSSTAEGIVSPASLTFTASNWMTEQTVTVRGVDDFTADGNQVYSIRVMALQAAGDSRYNGLNPADPAATNTDNDVAGVVVSPTSGLVTTEGGGTATFTVVLTSAPTASVSVSLSSSNQGEATVNPASVSFDGTNWSSPKTITVRGADDSSVDGDVGYSIITSNAISTDSRYNGFVVADVAVTNSDDEKAGGTPGGGAVDCTATSCGSSCEELANTHQLSDGSYLITAAGAKPFTVYCHNMKSAPTEYLPVSSENVSSFDMRATECGSKCGNFQVRFERLRLVLGRTMTIDSRDFTFATDNRRETCLVDNCDDYRMSWGAAGSCSDAGGRSTFDLRGTPFVIDDRAGRGGGGDRPYGEVNFSGDRRSGSVIGGGFCGSFGFAASAEHPVSANVPLRYSP